MQRIITLKNGKNITLEWNFLINEFLEEYPGGYDQLMKDFKLKKNLSKVNNYMMYACINANIEEPIEYYKLLKLVDLKCLNGIKRFLEDNEKEFKEFKKKDRAYFMNQKKKIKK